MEGLPDDVLLYMIRFVGFGDRKGANVVAYQRISKRWSELLYPTTRIEVEPRKEVHVAKWLQQYQEFYVQMQQRRNQSLTWDDYRGYFVITDYDKNVWMYYQQLLHRYYFEPCTVEFPHYRGQMYFYEYLM